MGIRGLSPRGRGSREYPGSRYVVKGSIPARAGEPTTPIARRARCWVYPRAGGGAERRRPKGGSLKGLSPRGRGSRVRMLPAQLQEGSIPARAGEPRAQSRGADQGRVYPRAGGGAIWLPACRRWAGGLSPRGRGSLRAGARADRSVGSIPARAGEPVRPRTRAFGHWVYPRAGGGARRSLNRARLSAGLSPRGRGSLRYGRQDVAGNGSIPARAGEPLPTNLLIHLHCQRAVAHRVALTAVLREERRPRPRCP